MKGHDARAVVRRFGAAALALAALAVVGTVLVTGAGASPMLLAGSTTYTDPAGDTPGAPDVTSVVIDGDATTSTMTVAVTAPGYTSALPPGQERYVLIWLDTDRNVDTGDPEDGTEWGLGAWTDSTGRWWDVSRWDGSEWDSVPQSATMAFTRSGDVLSWTISASDIGGATSFRFYIHACTWDPEAEEHVALDMAPNRGWWDYDISGGAPLPPVTPPLADSVSLLIGAPSTTPKQAIAGKRFTVDFRVAFAIESTVTIDDRTATMVTWEPVPSGEMICNPSVAGRTIAHVESLRNGRAKLSFVVPKAARGKLLSVKVRVTATEPESEKTVSATRVATFRIK